MKVGGEDKSINQSIDQSISVTWTDLWTSLSVTPLGPPLDHPHGLLLGPSPCPGGHRGRENGLDRLGGYHHVDDPPDSHHSTSTWASASKKRLLGSRNRSEVMVMHLLKEYLFTMTLISVQRKGRNNMNKYSYVLYLDTHISSVEFGVVESFDGSFGVLEGLHLHDAGVVVDAVHKG